MKRMWMRHLALLGAALAFAWPAHAFKVYAPQIEEGLALELQTEWMPDAAQASAWRQLAEISGRVLPRWHTGIYLVGDKAPGQARVRVRQWQWQHRIALTDPEAPFGVGLYAEYIHRQPRTDKLEFRLLLGGEHGRLNLIAERVLAGGEKWEIGYALRTPALALGEEQALVLEAYGVLGAWPRLRPGKELHRAGPVWIAEMGHWEWEIGWLAGSRGRTSHAWKFNLERHF